MQSILSDAWVMIYTNGNYVTDDPLDEDTLVPGESEHLHLAFVCDRGHANDCLREVDDIAEALQVQLYPRLVSRKTVRD